MIQTPDEQILYKKLNISISELSENVTKQRLSQYGLNELAAADPTSVWKVLSEQFKSLLILILLIAITLSAFLGQVITIPILGDLFTYSDGLYNRFSHRLQTAGRV